MLKKLMVLAAVLMIPFVMASAASAAPAQYPPSAGNESGGVAAGSGENGNANGTSLARTGSDSRPLVMVGIALVSVGGVALVTSRRLRHSS